MELQKIKLSERIIDHLIQAVLIFISIFLAFWLNNYQAKQEANEMTEKVKAVVLEELQQNLIILKRNTDYYKEIYHKSEDFLENGLDTLDGFSIGYFPGYTHGFEIFVLSGHTLSLANDPRVNLDVEDIAHLNRIKEELESFKVTMNDFHNFMNNKRNSDELTTIEKYYRFTFHLSHLSAHGGVLMSNMEKTKQSLLNSTITNK